MHILRHNYSIKNEYLQTIHVQCDPVTGVHGISA
jgi:hypothetical protein